MPRFYISMVADTRSAHSTATGTWLLKLAAPPDAGRWRSHYRLAPENPFPAAVEDALAGYRYLLARDLKSGRIAIAGLC